MGDRYYGGIADAGKPCARCADAGDNARDLCTSCWGFGFVPAPQPEPSVPPAERLDAIGRLTRQREGLGRLLAAGFAGPAARKYLDGGIDALTFAINAEQREYRP